MQFIEELVVEEFLPTVRSMLAARLRDAGLTQQEVGTLLGISQSSVSKYASGDVAGNDRIRNHPRVQTVVDELAEELAAGNGDRVFALLELEVLIRELEAGGLLATLHEQRVPALADRDLPVGDIHDPDSHLRASERTLVGLRAGLRILEHTPAFAQLIPHVGTNLVAALPDATAQHEVAGVPGRILAVNGQPMIPTEPVFGASEHVAAVLLAARSVGHDAQAALVIRYSDTILAELNAQGGTAVAFEPPADTTALPDAITGPVRDALTERTAVTAVYHTGAHGIEPVIYLLGESPEAVVETARELC